MARGKGKCYNKITFMLTVTGPSWGLAFLKFLAAVFFAFYIPGSLLLPSPVLATIVGLVLWGWQEFIFGYLKLRGFGYFYLLLAGFLWLKRRKESSLKVGFKKIDLWLALMMIGGVFIQTLPLWLNGVDWQEKGLLFTGGNTEDNLWHAALTFEMTKRFPPLGPGLAETLMANYHYWSNMVIAALIRVFNLPLFPTQFHFFPLLISLLLGTATLSLSRVLNFNQTLTRLFVFFNYFSGDLIYLFLIIVRFGPNIFFMSSLEDGTKFLHNPPRAFSYVIALAGLALFVQWRKKKQIKLGLLSMLLFASTTGFKIYTSLFSVPGLALLAGWAWLKKNWQDFFVYLTFPLLAALIYLPTNLEAGGLIWAPFSIVNNFIMQGALNLRHWEERRLIYLTHYNYLYHYFLEIVFTIIFLIGILGTKIISFFQPFSFVVKKLGKDLGFLLLTGILLSAIGGIFFVQTTGGANTFNFLVSIFLFGSILTALSVNYWQKRLPSFLTLPWLILVVSFTLPRVSYEAISNFSNFLEPKGFFISPQEQELYSFVNQNASPEARVGLDPNYYIGKNEPQAPFVSLFIDRPLFISGKGLLKHFGLDINQEEEAQKQIFSSTDKKTVAKTLLADNIEYLILYNNHLLKIENAESLTSVVFRNQGGKILKVNKEKLLDVLLEE